MKMGKKNEMSAVVGFLYVAKLNLEFIFTIVRLRKFIELKIF